MSKSKRNIVDVRKKKLPLLNVAVGLCIGFALGILFESGRNFFREQDLLNRLSWRNPSDYWFMTQQRKQFKAPEKLFKLPEFGFLKKKIVKEGPEQHILDPEKLKQNIEQQIAAMDVDKEQHAKYMKHKEEAAKVGAFT